MVVGEWVNGNDGTNKHCIAWKMYKFDKGWHMCINIFMKHGGNGRAHISKTTCITHTLKPTMSAVIIVEHMHCMLMLQARKHQPCMSKDWTNQSL